MNKIPINVQDSFFYTLRQDEKSVRVIFISGESRVGTLKRFDRFAIVMSIEGREEMIFKHAIASISADPAAGSGQPGTQPAR